MKEKTIYAQFRQIESKYDDLLIGYREDLTSIDRGILKSTQAGDELLWILKSAGTHLSYLPKTFCWDRYSGVVDRSVANKICYLSDIFVQASYWIGQSRGRSVPYKFFHVKVTRTMYGTVEEISDAKALELVNPIPLLEKEVAEAAYSDAKKGHYIPPKGKNVPDSLYSLYTEIYRESQRLAEAKS